MVEIRHKVTGDVLLSIEVDLRGANLHGADLRGANLDGEILSKTPINITNMTY